MGPPRPNPKSKIAGKKNFCRFFIIFNTLGRVSGQKVKLWKFSICKRPRLGHISFSWVPMTLKTKTGGQQGS